MGQRYPYELQNDPYMEDNKPGLEYKFPLVLVLAVERYSSTHDGTVSADNELRSQDQLPVPTQSLPELVDTS